MEADETDFREPRPKIILAAKPARVKMANMHNRSHRLLRRSARFDIFIRQRQRQLIWCGESFKGRFFIRRPRIKITRMPLPLAAVKTADISRERIPQKKNH